MNAYPLAMNAYPPAMRGGFREFGRKPEGSWDQRPARGSRGRGGHGYRGRGNSRSYHPPYISAVPSPPLGELIESIGKKDLVQDAKSYLDTAAIQDYTVVSGYNWLAGGEPAIVVPGRPPRWTPFAEETKLAEDSGDYYRDANAARFPAHLMEATVLAALAADPGLPAVTDLVSCSHSLMHLLRFVLDEAKTFRILVQVVDGAVFLVRRENSPTETLVGINGHGQTFLQACTTWDADSARSAADQGNHRIAKYRFGGLNMLVRYEADAYIPVEKPAASRNPPADLDDICKLIGSIDFDNVVKKAGSRSAIPPPRSSNPTAITLTLTPGAQPVPQSQLVEIKTRIIWKKTQEDTARELMPKLWLTQIPNLAVAYHRSGTFERGIRPRDVRDRVGRWERQAAPDLACLAALLHRVVRLARARADGRVELTRAEAGEVVVSAQAAGAGEVLSERARGLWRKGREVDEGVALDEDDEEDDKDEDEDKDDKDDDEDDEDDEIGWGRDEDKDWAQCSEACGYCGNCKKKSSS